MVHKFRNARLRVHLKYEYIHEIMVFMTFRKVLIDIFDDAFKFKTIN